MADRRIQIAADKSEFIRELSARDGNSDGPFDRYYDALVFAAALAAARNQSSPLGQRAQKPDPIRLGTFETHGLDTVINILAVFKENDPNILANTDEMEDRRATIFEEYANAGLEILQKELAGSPSYSEHIMLMLQREKKKSDKPDADGFDISQLID